MVGDSQMYSRAEADSRAFHKSRAELVNGLHGRALTVIDFFAARQSGEYFAAPSPDLEFTFGAQVNLDLFFRYFRSGIEPTENESRPLTRRAITMIESGVTLQDILDNYRFVVSSLWSSLLGSATDQVRAVMLDMALPLMQYLLITSSRIAVACTEHIGNSRWDLIEQRRRIGSALLAGTEPLERGPDTDFPIADRFLVAVCRAGSERFEAAMRIRARVSRMGNSFVIRDEKGWTALVPLGEHDDTGTDKIEELQSLLSTTAGDAPGPGLWVGVSAAHNRSEIPARAAEARVLAELGSSLRLDTMICRKDALRFEYIVASSSPDARLWMAQLLEPLDSHPVLQSTVEAFVSCAFNQAAAARILHIHRNSMAYRLLRIRELTGLDPTVPPDAIALAAAHTARRIKLALP
ncbi:CdaR family transcriptional regulator [Nocardia sp. CS682]|uniref:PucR family transcriptional regulator n=1 Tax=Nocardia sp. CS682 TaxID=1047172 RepID=UPI001074E501|nr:PucR family transcriptional regulator [Nocardia sp. CS682]QBS45306.1 hypothetical protein DMB37_39745 [Nocardia sp. CS682]